MRGLEEYPQKNQDAEDKPRDPGPNHFTSYGRARVSGMSSLTGPKPDPSLPDLPPSEHRRHCAPTDQRLPHAQEEDNGADRANRRKDVHEPRPVEI